ncbi:hypothetical protein [Sphingobium xanthum]|uniref:dioxygenase family protein n=1 Tax=Sphingobium xanthum TaxID=1387165 RepID=UPI001FE8BBAA|nr:hypothetical protein [Sphingobium xanthum]
MYRSVFSLEGEENISFREGVGTRCGRELGRASRSNTEAALRRRHYFCTRRRRGAEEAALFFRVSASPRESENADLWSAADLAESIGGGRLHVVGSVCGVEGSAIPNATVDFWQADHEGNYEAQLGADEPRLRAILSTDAAGKFDFWTVMPLGYTIPMDGPVGDLIGRTAISNYRPAHIHFIVSAPGFGTLVTHLFPEGADYLDDDVVFGVRPQLVVPFKAVAASHHEVRYDFVLTASD